MALTANISLVKVMIGISAIVLYCFIILNIYFTDYVVFQSTSKYCQLNHCRPKWVFCDTSGLVNDQ